MRAHELIGAQVVTANGERLGRVFDLEASATGPELNEVVGKAFELSALLVGGSAFLHRLGFSRRDMRGPIGVRFLARRLPGYKVSWDQVEGIDANRITLSCKKSAVKRVDQL